MTRHTAQPTSVCATSGEDKALTAFLNRKIAEILSPHHEPVPDCHRCGGRRVSTYGAKMRTSGKRPQFRCTTCGTTFQRTCGTPFHRKPYITKMEILVPLLSQPLSLAQAGALMGSLGVDVRKRVREIRRWLLKLDPSGEWECRVLLGGRLAELRASQLQFEEAGAREDTGLTERLTIAFDDLNSQSLSPVPDCPYCGNSDTTLLAFKRVAFPRFECRACSRNFSRRTGTAFARTKCANLDLMRQTIRYLSLPLQFSQVAESIGIEDAVYIRRWRDMFIAFADELEPGGTLSARIKLGVDPTPTTPCPFCGRTGMARRASTGWTCGGCGRLFSMRRSVIEREGYLEISPADEQNPEHLAEPGHPGLT